MDDLIREIEGVQIELQRSSYAREDAEVMIGYIGQLAGLTVALARQVQTVIREHEGHTHGLRVSEHRAGKAIKAGY